MNMHRNNQYSNQPPPQLPQRNDMASFSPMLPHLNLPLSALLMPPPPPPPLPVPTTTQTHTAPPHTYTAILPRISEVRFITLQLAAPPPIVHPVYSTPSQVPLFEFDASRPPPAIGIQPQLNGSLRRRADQPVEARCKVRKTEVAEDDSPCAACLQREIRIAQLQQHAKTLQREAEKRNMILKKKKEQFENRKLLLQSGMNPHLFQAIEEYIEMKPSEPQDVLSQLELILNNSNRIDSLNDTGIIDEPDLLQALSVALRKESLVNNKIQTELIRKTLGLSSNNSSLMNLGGKTETYLSGVSNLPSTSNGSQGLPDVFSLSREVGRSPNMTQAANVEAGPMFGHSSFVPVVPPVFTAPPPVVTALPPVIASPYQNSDTIGPYYQPGSSNQSTRHGYTPYSNTPRFTNRYFPPHQ